MSRLTDLLSQVRLLNPELARDLDAETKALTGLRRFGLNFERHVPEAVELYGRPIRRGDKVRILPPRGEADGSNERYVVTEISSGLATLVPAAVSTAQETTDSVGLETTTHSILDLVVVAEHRDPVYPGLVSTGSVRRGPADKPAHVVINGENYHALEALLWAHEGKVDAIYIDPPYNTGAKDWKYNNDYVASDDAYRHSKWLAFMERRLKLAKRLLNPENSVLIVTIDEKEYLRLGLLLEQQFPDSRIQMVTSVINPSGSSRTDLFSRSDEYVFFVFRGSARVLASSDDMLNDASAAARFDVRWDSLRRRGLASRRARIPSLYYPIYFDSESGRLDHVGEPVPVGSHSAEQIPGLDCVLPIAPDGAEMTWSLSPEGFIERLARGFIRYYRNGAGGYVIRYVQEGTIRAVENGDAAQDGTDEHGFPRWTFIAARRMTPMTTWRRPSHSASDYGTPMLTSMVPGGRTFPYPKSLYAVEDALRFFVKDKPDALIVDFFAGSGTTAHAVMRLNRQDGGHRRTILVTNNEVSADEQKNLREQGLRPGDPEWERWGICDYITKPRIEAAITGRTPDGEPIRGDYRFTDEFPMAEGFEENAEFFTLTYESPVAIAHGYAFGAVAPLLWLRAGARGSVIETPDVDLATTAHSESHAVLWDLDASAEFLSEVVDRESIRTVYIVTEDERAYQQVCAELPQRVEPVRLYESMLTAARMNAERG